MKIAVDFDGTIVDHRFPDVGGPVPGALYWMKQLQAAGAELILFTMRSGQALDDAVDYCRHNGIEFYGVNTDPEQSSWTESPKAYASVYIDDAAFGCPLRENYRMGGRPMVDWDRVGPAVLAWLRGETKHPCPPAQE